ncbi:AraC family transcriptional regulator, partial [Candidatus Saccharibacteria bacterium]|nr:AraC family transcriptional regulator [Candidatus Saccharibacteria bacterium]
LADLAAVKPTTSAPKPAATHGPSVAPITPPSESAAPAQPSAADQLKNFIEANPARTAPTIPKLGQREIPLAKQVATPRGIAIPKR